MDVQHLEVRLPATASAALELGAAIPAFHRWIRERAGEELLVDVADYRHVPGGPGVLLIGHDADYGLATVGAEVPGVAADGPAADGPAADGPAADGPAANSAAATGAVAGAALCYQRKTALPGSNAERIAQACGAAARAALRLAAEPELAGKLRFAVDGLHLAVNDRLLAPNTPATAQALLPVLRAGFAAWLGHADFTLEPETDPRRRFAVTLHTTRATPLESLV